MLTGLYARRGDLDVGSARATDGFYTIPGWTAIGQNTVTLAANQRVYYRMWTPAPIVVDQLVVEVTTGAAGVARIGLLAASNAWQPTQVLAASGDIDTTTAGVKVFTFPSPVTVYGRLLAVWTANAAVTIRESQGGLPETDVPNAMGSTPVVARRITSSAPLAVDLTNWATYQAGTFERCGFVLRRVL